MEIKVFVTQKRKCFASFDWKKDQEIWIMSFGDLITPNLDVEIEFTDGQIKELYRSLGEVWYAIEKREEVEKAKHIGSC